MTHIRFMIHRDLKEAVDIEQRNFQDPWTKDEFKKYLNTRSVIGMVAERDNKILGYVIYEIKKGSLEILNFSVDPLYQREGIGSTILGTIKGKLSPKRRNRIEVIVGDTSLNAHLFLKNQGFLAIDIKKRHFDDGQDGYVFEFLLDSA